MSFFLLSLGGILVEFWWEGGERPQIEDPTKNLETHTHTHMAQNTRTPILAKCGLAKCGHDLQGWAGLQGGRGGA